MHNPKKNFNRIIALHNSDGEWIFKPEILKTEAIKFFQNLYGKALGSLRNLPPNSFLWLDHEYIDFLGRVVTNEEIKIALFNMAPLKAPGSDGFHALFF